MPAVQPATRCPTGISGLDAVLHGGLLANRLYLIEGTPGSGKTTLALQFLLEGIRRGETCLYVTLSETADELRAGALSHGLSLDGMDIFELVSEQDGDNEQTMYHPSEVELIDTTRRVLQAVEAKQPRRMVFDSLSEFRLLAQGSLRYRRQILALKQFFINRDCTVLLLDDRTAEGQDLQLQSIAHGVISLDHRAPAYGRVRRQMQIVKFRGSDFSSGLHDVRIQFGGLTVFPRLISADHGRDYVRQPVASGVLELDQLLGGGIDRGTSTLLIGPAGSGKSTVAMQYCAAAAARGDHAAIFCFEESRAILLERAQGVGISLVEGKGAGQVHIRQIDPAEVSPGELTHLVQKSVEEDHAQVVMLDSLNGYLNAMPEDQFLTLQMHELLSFLNNHGVATFLIATQTGLMGPNMNSPVDTSYLADAVMVMRFFEHEGKVKKAVSMLKKRSGPHEETIRQIWFDAQGIHLSAPLSHLRGVLGGVPIEQQVTAGIPAGGGGER